MRLQDVSKKVWEQTKLRQERGKIPAFLGVDGLLALMYKNITEWHEEQGELKPKQLMELAVHSLVALQLGLEQEDRSKPLNELKETTFKIPQERLESPDETPSTPNGIPDQPPQYDGWQFDPKKAAGLRQWLQKGGWWDQLEDHQQEGIEDVIINGGKA